MEDVQSDVGEGEVRNGVEEQEDVVMVTGTQPQEREEQESPLTMAPRQGNEEEGNDPEDGRENQRGV